MKPAFVYHGSGRKLKGKKLTPKKAIDLEKNPENLLTGVYASELKEEAIVMSILSCKGVEYASCEVYKNEKETSIKALIYEGWPHQKHIYLYILPSKTFENRPKKSSQWVSLKAVQPKRVERLPLKDYLYLVKKATKKQRREWVQKDRSSAQLKKSSEQS